MEIQWQTRSVVVAVIVHALVSSGFFHVVYTVQPTPFIDEVFHVPQAQRYCSGNFTEWDPKITTLPGLYVLSVGCLGYVSGLHQPTCTVYSLRLVNLLFALCLPVVFYSILKVLNTDESVSEWQHVVESVSLSQFPLLFTYVSLYYTDLVSAVCVLLMYSLQLHKYLFTSAAIGGVAVLVRQNNVVWVAVMAALCSCDCLLELLRARRPLAKRKSYDVTSTRIFWDARSLFNSHSSDLLKLSELISYVVAVSTPHMLVCCAFAAFAIYNGGIVVGDRQAHAVNSNAAQLVYFLLVAAPFLAPHVFANLPELRSCMRQGVVRWCCVLGSCVLLLESGASSAAHPYLLADNRHVAFYLWRRVLARSGVRVLFAPVALIALVCMCVCTRARPLPVRILLSGACVLLLGSCGLLELRYFILPFLMVRLQFAVAGVRVALLEALLYLVVNLAALALFSLKTFTWEDQPGLQRIIW